MLRASSMWLIVPWLLVLPDAALAVSGGSPSDPNSCYANCGDLKGSGQNCYCDSACESFGDCCADKHEYCSPQAAKPVCSLVDDRKVNSLVCGTDLGFTFQHGSELEMIFGDTWHYPNATATSCEDPGVVTGVDDSQARLPVTRPGWAPTTAVSAAPTGASCPSILNFDRSAPSAPYTFTPIELRQRTGPGPNDWVALSLSLGETPLAAWSDGTTVFAMFGRSTLDGHRVYVGSRDAAVRTRYWLLADLGVTTKFHNPTAARTTSESVFDPPTGSGASTVFLWGRPKFMSTNVEANSNPLYLMKLSMPFSSWTPSYFTGIQANGTPGWSTSIAAAQPVFSADFKQTNQLDIKWIKELKKWVMLYGGDIADAFDPTASFTHASDSQPRHGAIHMRTADFPWGPWSRPTPLMWREQMGPYYQCDAYDSTTPSGCDRKYLPAPSYPTGDWEPGLTAYQNGACQTTHPRPAPTPNLQFPFPFCAASSQRGNLYAPNLLPTWTRHTGVDASTGLSSTTLYFALSTWYPYDVVLAAVDLARPSNVYPLRMQLRNQATSRMVSAGSPPSLSTTAGGTGGGSVSLVVEKADGSSGAQPKLGDVVILRNGSGRLARTGSSLVRVALGSAVTDDQRWTLLSSSASSPTGSLLVPGSTLFRLAPLSAPTLYLKAPTSSSLSITSGASSDGVWKLSYWCQAGDVCAR